MKKGIYLLFFLTVSYFTHAQTINNFFYEPGCNDLGFIAHPTNTYSHSSYEIEPDYVIVYINYKEDIETKIRLGRGSWPLYFNSIESLYDDDIVNPFFAFGLGSAFLAQLQKEAGPNKYNEIREALILLLGRDPENWNSADWALFALNIDYANKLS